MNIDGFFFPPLFLSSPYYASHGLSPMWVHCSLDSLAGTTQGHSTHVFCAVLLIASLFVSCPFSCKPEYCWQQISLPTARAVFSISFSFFNVVEGCCQSWNFITYSESLPDVSFLELCMLSWCRLSQGSGFSTVADHLEPQAADRSLLADKSAAQHH